MITPAADTSRELEIWPRGVFVRLDAEDYDRARSFCSDFKRSPYWRVERVGGKDLVTLRITTDGKHERIYLHHLVLGMLCDPAKARVRFLNGNTLDCRRENLAFSKKHCSSSEEIICEKEGVFAAYISYKPMRIGKFATEGEALAAQTEVRVAIVKAIAELKIKFNKQAPQVVKQELEDLVQSVKLAVQQEDDANPWKRLGKKK